MRSIADGYECIRALIYVRAGFLYIKATAEVMAVKEREFGPVIKNRADSCASIMRLEDFPSRWNSSRVISDFMSELKKEREEKER